MGGKPFLVIVAAGTAVALALTAFLLLRQAPPTLDNMSDHPFGDPSMAATEEDRNALLILNGAETARKKRMPETALRFYEDVDLRYAHTAVYAHYHAQIWDEMRQCHAAIGAGAEAAPRFIEARRALHERWLRLKAGPRSKPELQAYLKDLPPDDGRRPQVEAWIAE